MLNVGERGSGVRQRPAGFDQHFDELRNKCLKQKILFRDPEFDTYDLSVSHRDIQKNQLEWRRPNEITADPKFFIQGASRFDVRQGKLGDCWLLAAIANLTLDDKLFYKVVPFDQGFHIKYAGIFHFQFWQFGRWVDVVIDDRLPTHKGKLLFLQSSTKNEFWSALLEKAYAKKMLNVGERGSGVRQRPAGFDQHFDELRNKCLKQKILFRDPEFDTYDLSVSHRDIQKNQLEWRRPNEITADPKFFIQGASRFDVRQGKLGDCWLLAAIANLTLDDKLFYKVVPFDQGFHIKYAGIFHFQFWQFGRWVDVVIDDRLPTHKGKLLFLQSSTKNEFWSALLEKAYAKIKGSYEALDGGFTVEAMRDFTGGVSETYELNKEPPNLFTIMLNSFQRKSLMCGAIYKNKLSDPTKKGLVPGHAYSITRITYIPENNIPLIRLRNPWGNDKEWNGRWSDKSEEWLNIPQQLIKSIGLIKEDDGEFWMPFEDFVRYFSALNICHLAPNSYIDWEKYGASGKKKWDLSLFDGEWVRGTTAGGCDKFQETFSSNPQYYITLVDPDENDNKNMCTVIIALMLKETRRQKKHRDKSLSFGFYVYNLNNSKSVPKPLDTHFFKNNDPFEKVHCSEFEPREVCKRLSVPPGKYCIIPYTFNQNEQGAFLLRVFSEKNNNLAEFDKAVGMVEIDDKIKKLALYSNTSDDLNDKIKKYFFKISGSDKEVDWMDLKNILEFSMKDTGNTKFSNDVCRCLIAMMDWDRSGKLGFKEFERLLMDIRQWQVVFKKYDKKNNGYIKGFELRPALSSVGYHIKPRTINTMCHRYANKKGHIMFDDFIMCAIRLKTTIDIFKEHDPENKNVVSFTLEDWVEKTFYS